MIDGHRTIELAWAGWRARMPRDWRPLGLGGDARSGFMVVGDAQGAILRVKWFRPGKGRFDARRWALRCGRRLAGRTGQVREVDGAPSFDVAARVGGKARRGGGESWAWYGFARGAGLGLELLASGRVDARQRKTLEDLLLPSLRATPSGEPTRWAVFGASFLSPPGFLLRAAQLHLGDIALCLAAPGGRRLLLRQVYPADLALSRRGLEAWLDYPPFRQQRRFRRHGEVQPWQAVSSGRRLEGILRRGRKALPSPLGWLARKETLAGAVRDLGLERLLLAEYDGTGPEGPGVVQEALGGMNWAILEEGSRA